MNTLSKTILLITSLLLLGLFTGCSLTTEEPTEETTAEEETTEEETTEEETNEEETNEESLSSQDKQYAFGIYTALAFAPLSGDPAVSTSTDGDTTTYTFTEYQYNSEDASYLVSGTIAETTVDANTNSVTLNLTFSGDSILETITGTYEYDASGASTVATGNMVINGVDVPAQEYYDWLADNMGS